MQRLLSSGILQINLEHGVWIRISAITAELLHVLQLRRREI
jgi:hypothetical protein